MKHTAIPARRQRNTRWHVRLAPARLRILAASLACLSQSPAAQAFEVQTGTPDLTLNWDTTLKYSAAARTTKRADALISGGTTSNQDDGDRNFKRGLISNRVDVYSEADLKYQNVGARVSAAGWYDAVYNRGNSNNSPATSNNFSVPTNEFPEDTRNVSGRKAELLDAFVFGRTVLGSVPVNVRLGKHALQWGESLFFGGNGIAGAMVPLDILKAALIPNSLVREIVRPVGQVSGTAEITPSVSVAAYYQYKWDKTRLPPAGSYFSAGDILDAGGECLLLGSCRPNVPGPKALRTPDQGGKDSGQYGVKLRFSDKESGFDYGLYALRFHSKLPQVVTTAGAPPAPPFPTSYRLAYQEGIKLLGASFAFTSGAFQWSGEASTRRGTPLVGAGSNAAGNNNSDNAGYALGNTGHAQVALLATLPQSTVSDGGAFLAEVAWNRVLSVTRNPNLVSKTGERDSWAFRAVLSPSFNQVLDGLDISVPIGLGYSPKGKSLSVSQFATDKGGDLTIGLSGTYLNLWQVGASYRHFFGSAAPAQDGTNEFTYKQVLRDRDFISISLSRTF